MTNEPLSTPRRMLVEDQPADLRVVEVVLPVGGGRCGRVVGERHLAGLVVHEEVGPPAALRADRDPVRDRLESVPAREHVPDRQERRDVTPGLTGVSIDGFPVLKPLLLSPAAAEAAPEDVNATATAAHATIERLLMSSPRVVVCVV